jgi:hypothetical protein
MTVHKALEEVQKLLDENRVLKKEVRRLGDIIAEMAIGQFYNKAEGLAKEIAFEGVCKLVGVSFEEAVRGARYAKYNACANGEYWLIDRERGLAKMRQLLGASK